MVTLGHLEHLVEPEPLRLVHLDHLALQAHPEPQEDLELQAMMANRRLVPQRPPVTWVHPVTWGLQVQPARLACPAKAVETELLVPKACQECLVPQVPLASQAQPGRPERPESREKRASAPNIAPLTAAFSLMTALCTKCEQCDSCTVKFDNCLTFVLYFVCFPNLMTFYVAVCAKDIFRFAPRG